jgi:Fe-S cluster assembly ATP-binding protein
MLRIDDLYVAVGGKEIIRGLTLHVPAGEAHALMGPNGSGKSTLAFALAGREGYESTSGTATFDGEDVFKLDAHERAAKGLFLSFQHPPEIPGVAAMNFMRTALNAQRKARGENELSAAEFLKLAREKARAVGIADEQLKRAFNVGFSGGEKKRMEMLQLAVFAPRFAVLDETDSGLDIDALKMVADVVNGLRNSRRGFLVITHYQRLLEHLRPDRVHVLARGRIAKSGGPELARELEAAGYERFIEAA